METNNLTIIPPEGMEAYQEGNKIKFRPIKKELTYINIARELFDGKDVWRVVNCNIDKYKNTPNWDFYTNCTSKKQAQKLLAINKLMNVAKYLNGDWKPNWNDNGKGKYFILMDYNNMIVDCNTSYIYNTVYFKSKELAQQAIDILGEETIKLALCTDW